MERPAGNILQPNRLILAIVQDEDAAVLSDAIALVRAKGAPLAADEFATAELILPFADATIDEVNKLLADGTIPGESIGLP